MLRIRRVGETTTEIVLKLEGRIAYQEGLLLRVECARWQRRFRSIVLDLSDVTLVDPTGIRILRTMLADQVRIAGASPLIQQMLEHPPSQEN